MAANFLMENAMESASLENERLRTKLKECQDALEALAREGQAKDCRITQLQATVLVTKSDLSEIMRKHERPEDSENAQGIACHADRRDRCVD